MTEYVVGELEKVKFRQCNGDGQDNRNTLRDAKASNSTARVQTGNTVLLFCVFVFGCGQSSPLCGLFSSHREQELLLVAVHGFLIAVLFLLWSAGSRVYRFNSVVPGLQRASCGTQVQLVHGMSDHLGSGIELMSPALAGGFLTAAPPGRPQMGNI